MIYEKSKDTIPYDIKFDDIPWVNLNFVCYINIHNKNVIVFKFLNKNIVAWKYKTEEKAHEAADDIKRIMSSNNHDK